VLPAVDQRTGDDWVSRRVASNGVVCVAWQQVSVGKHHAGARCDVHVGGRLLQFWIGNQLCKTVARTSRGQVRKKRASIRRMNVRRQAAGRSSVSGKLGISGSARPRWTSLGRFQASAS